MSHTLHGTLELLHDRKGTSTYVGLSLHQNTLLETCWDHLLGLGLDEAIEARHARDGKGHAHVTFASAGEWGGLTKYHPEMAQTVRSLFGQDLAVVLHGIGLATSPASASKAWFGIVSSDALDKLREAVGLRPKEFHATLAFAPKDVFDAPKGMGSMIVPIDALVYPSAVLYESMGPR